MNLAQRILELLNGVPQPFSTTAIIAHCGQGYRKPRSTIREQLLRLERVKQIHKIGNPVTARAVSWLGAKWTLTGG